MKKLLTCGLLLLVGCIAAQTTISKNFPPNHFLVYNTTHGLPGNIIYDIAIDMGGFVWVGTNNGLGRYDGQRFIAFKDLVGLSDIPQTSIVSIFADSHHCLWVRFNTQDIYCIDLQTYKVRFINKDYSEHKPPFNRHFYCQNDRQ